MKKSVALAALVLLGLLAAPACVSRVIVHQPAAPPPPSHFPPGASAAVEQFYDDLSPYGGWIQVDGPGWVWRPAHVAAGWRPYTLGRWVYSDFGWTWASDENWGWAVYHHGRWHHAAGHGWVWVPGTEWGPAWVSWHSGGGWIGWAPLPWQVEWRGNAGLDWGRVDVRVAIEPAWWCFVPTRHLTDPSPARHFAPAGRNITLVKITKNVTHYTLVDNRVFNRGVLVNEVGRAAGRPVHQVRVRQTDSPRAVSNGALQGDELVVFRPGLRRGQDPGGTPGHQKQRDREVSARSAASDRSAPPDVSGNEPPPSDKTPAADRHRPTRPQATWRDRGPRAPEDRPTGRPGHTSASESTPADSPDDSAPSGSTPSPAEKARPKADSPRPNPVGNRPGSGNARPAPESTRPAPGSVSKDDDTPGSDAAERGRSQAVTPRPARPKPGAPRGKSSNDQGKESGKKKDTGSDKKSGAETGEEAAEAPKSDETPEGSE